MQSTYTVQQAQKILGIPVSAIRRLIGTGFVAPARGSRREYLFSFRDLVVLRMAKVLIDAGVTSRRMGTALRHLRKQLPESPPLTGLRISALGHDVIVEERGAQWRAANGQYLLALEVSQRAGSLSFEQPVVHQPGADWFADAYALEDSDPGASMLLYEKAIEHDPAMAGAYANLGRLLHDAGRIEQAETVYRAGDDACPGDALLLFNFALLKEDQDRLHEAIELYKRALVADPALGDAHYNLGLIYHSLKSEREAVRHFSAYRKLSDSSN
ncbi:MAG: tetratricopeptide repeat protein [Betaproteobacteria bacterium]